MNKNHGKVTTHSFIIPNFNQKIEVMIGSQESVNKLWNKRNYSLNLENVADAACFGGDEHLCIWFEKNPTIGLVTHESAHAAFAIMKAYGVSLEDEEVFCYLHEFIVDSILKCVKVTLPTAMAHTNRKYKQEVERQLL